MKYKGRKTYSSKDAKNEIQCCKMSIETSWDSIQTMLHNPSILCLAMCHQTIDGVISEEIERMEYQASKIEYMRKFLK